jgi:hypothetical protein
MEIISEAKQKDINIYAIKNNWPLNGSIENNLEASGFEDHPGISREDQ